MPLRRSLATCKNFLGGMVLMLSLSGCGSGYVDGWRSEEGLTKEERCNTVENRQWTGSSCVTDKEFQLTRASKAQCEQRVDTAWLEESCQTIESLNKGSCQSSANLVWTGLLCMTKVQNDCESNPAKVFVDGQCLERVKPPK